MRRTTQV